MMHTLQLIINLLEYPAFLKDDKKILMVNDLFNDYGFSKEKIEKQIDCKQYKISEKKINKNLAIFEIIPEEIQTLKECTKKLTQAIKLLNHE
jgi:hypothetical protein